jgi:sugar porter (SP) family MFS transporter
MKSYDKTFVMCFSLSIALGSFNAGYQIGVLNSLKNLFMHKFGYNQIKMDNYWPWASTSLTIAAAVFTLLGGIITKLLGRKKMMHFINFISIVGALVVQINGPAFLILGRAIFGIAMGLYLYLSPLYISEISPAQDRGRYTSLHQLMIVFAIFLGALLALAIPNTDVNGGLTNNNFYRFILFVPIIVAVLQSTLISILFGYESPKFLYFAGRMEECKASLSRIYGNEEDINTVMTSLKSEQEKEQQNSATFCSLIKATSYAVILGCFVSFAQQMTGVNSIMYYSTNILDNVFHQNHSKAKTGTVLIDVAQIVFTALSLAIVDKAGRKLLLLLGCIGCGVTQIIFGVYYRSDATNTQNYLGLTMMILFISFFSLSHGPVCWSYLSEIMHAKTLSLAVCVNLIFTIAITAVTPPLTNQSKLGRKSSIIFYVYGGLMAFSLLILSIFMKETKGKTSEEITQMFSKTAPTETAKTPLTENDPKESTL